MEGNGREWKGMECMYVYIMVIKPLLSGMILRINVADARIGAVSVIHYAWSKVGVRFSWMGNAKNHQTLQNSD